MKIRRGTLRWCRVWSFSKSHVENEAGIYDGWQVGWLQWTRWESDYK